MSNKEYNTTVPLKEIKSSGDSEQPQEQSIEDGANSSTKWNLMREKVTLYKNLQTNPNDSSESESIKEHIRNLFFSFSWPQKLKFKFGKPISIF